jgi:predicted ester cyclase
VARLVTKGTLKEEVPGFPPPGKPFEVSSIYIFTLKNGKIMEGRGEVDMLGLMIQLGMELKPRAEK